MSIILEIYDNHFPYIMQHSIFDSTLTLTIIILFTQQAHIVTNSANYLITLPIGSDKDLANGNDIGSFGLLLIGQANKRPPWEIFELRC